MTALGGKILAADGWLGAGITFYTLLGGALSAGGASAINQCIDRDRDRFMQRTSYRSIPSGKVEPQLGLLFGIALSSVGSIIFPQKANPYATKYCATIL